MSDQNKLPENSEQECAANAHPLENNPAPRRLWLDDIRPAPEGWVWVKNFEQAVNALAAEPWDEASLDHDLADWHYAANSLTGQCTSPSENARRQEKTGYHVALWMVENRVFPPQVWIHSMNPSGAQSMLLLLQRHHPAGAGAVTRRMPY